MINSIRLSNLRNNELLQFIKDIVKHCRRFDIVALLLEAAVINLESIIAMLEDTFNKEQGSDVTELLAQLDAARDKAITGIKLFCEANTYQNDTAISSAAELLLASINRHGHSIAKLNYPAETTVIDSIIADWESNNKLITAIKTLKLSSWTALLKADNQKFSTTYHDRVEDKLSNSADSFSDLRASAINSYKALCDNVFAYSIINSSEEYKKVANAMNIIIADYNSILAKREGKADEEI